MAINDILLRVATHPTLSAKGSELTYEELDANFIELYEYLAAMNNGSGLQPYNNTTTYSGVVYVSYNGNIYKHISLTDTTGVIPDSDPTKWELTSIGALAHAQNTDQWLDYGGAYQVSAQQIYELINNQVVATDTASFIALANSGDLLPNMIYAITDFTLGYLYIKTVGGKYFSPRAVLQQYYPDTSVAPVWVSGGTYAVNSKVSWDARVYRNLTGTNSGTPDGDATRWLVLSPSAVNGYAYQTFDARIKFEGTTIQILHATELRTGNEYGQLDFVSTVFGIIGDVNSTNNLCCPNSSVNHLSRVVGNITSNRLVNSSFAFDLGGELQASGITGNTLTGSVISSAGKFDGIIENCTLLNTQVAFPDGASSTLELSGCRFYFAGRTNIQIRANAGTLSAIDIDNHGSNAEDTIDITGLNTVDLSTNGYPDIYGVIILDSANATETIEKIENGLHAFPIIIKPVNGLTVTFVPVSFAGVTANGAFVGNSGSTFALNGTRGEYAIFKPITVGGFDAYQVETIIQNS